MASVFTKACSNREKTRVATYVRVDGIYYQVIGMSSSEGDMNIQGRASEAVTLPFTTMQQTYNLGGQIDVICFTVKRGVKVSDVQPQMEEIIKAAHYIAPNDKQALMYLNAEAMFSMVDNLFTGIHILIWMVGLGTLLAVHWCIEYHDGDSERTHYRNRHTPCHRCTPRKTSCSKSYLKAWS